jgi:hypothetical protein
MPRKKKKPADSRPSITVGGDVGGPIIVGDHNVHVGTAGPGSTLTVAGGSISQVLDASQQARLGRLATQDEIASLVNSIRALDETIRAEAPPEAQAEALKQADEVKAAVTSEKPDVDRMARARQWFVEQLPGILGAVTGVLTHPVVGRLVEAAGEFTLKQFRARLGLPDVE